MSPKTVSAGTRSAKIAVTVTAAVLVLAGLAHRSLLARIQGVVGEPLKLSRPLSTLPLEFASWKGREVSMPERVRRIAGEDDFVNREYVNSQLGRSVSLYVGYIGRPRSRMGHRPDVCYITHGYEQVSEEPLIIEGADEIKIPALLYEFRSPEIAGHRQLVLVLYSINGRYVNSAASANDYNIRRAGLTGTNSYYVARIQVAVPATGDRDGDLAILSQFTSQVIPPLAEIMPNGDRE